VAFFAQSAADLNRPSTSSNGRYGDSFERTVRGLEVGLKVGDIATFELATCVVDDDASEVLARPELEAFSAIPVRGPHAIVGVLERNGAREGRVADALSPGRPWSADRRHRDLERCAQLPARLLVFALITQLETLMADAIVARFGDRAWIDEMKPKGRVLKEKIELLRARELDPPLIELWN
jgi:hypothetical protein